MFHLFRCLHKQVNLRQLLLQFFFTEKFSRFSQPQNKGKWNHKLQSFLLLVLVLLPTIATLGGGGGDGDHHYSPNMIICPGQPTEQAAKNKKDEKYNSLQSDEERNDITRHALGNSLVELQTKHNRAKYQSTTNNNRMRIFSSSLLFFSLFRPLNLGVFLFFLATREEEF